MPADTARPAARIIRTVPMVVMAPPLVVEGLHRLGCDVVAATGFLAQLPALTARLCPDVVLVHADGRDMAVLVRALVAIREMLPSVRFVVLLPQLEGASAIADLDAVLDTHEVSADRLRELIGGAQLGPVVLTPRELEVLRLVADGHTNRAIGRRLGLQLDTVKNYLRSVHRKLGARSRTDAVMIAARLGLLVLPGRDASVRPAS